MQSWGLFLIIFLKASLYCQFRDVLQYMLKCGIFLDGHGFRHEFTMVLP